MAFEFGEFVVDAQRRALLVSGKPYPLGGRAFDLLLALVERRDRVVSKTELIDLVWPHAVVEENNLQVHISALRKALGHGAIATVAGRGYRFTPDLRDGVLDSSASATAAGNLSATPPELIGREADLDTLVALVNEHRIVTTCGAAGMGKTTLAAAAAQAVHRDFRDGAWMIELAPVTQPALVPTAIARALHMSLAVEAHAGALGDALTEKRMLLVLDNCEHLLEAAAAVAIDIMKRAPEVTLLVTSQEVLKVPGEHVYRLPPLAVPSQPDDAGAMHCGAVHLFAARARAADPRFELGPANVADIAEICTRLDGIPLAIELAAARTPLLGVAGVRARLHERFRLLGGGSRSAMPRHQTLRAAMDWSHALLSPAEQEVFRRLGVFSGTFNLESAQLVALRPPQGEWDMLNLMGSLVDKSLVVAEPGESPRYRLLETARADALQRLDQCGEREDAQSRHAQAVLDLFEKSRIEEFDLPLAKMLARYIPDLDNARSALDWLASRPDEGRRHVALAGCMGWLWVPSGLRPEGIRRSREARARISAETPPREEARMLVALARASYPLANADLLMGLDRAIALHREAGDEFHLCEALCLGSAVLLRADRPDEAGRLVAEAKSLLKPGWPLVLRFACVRSIAQYHDQANRAAESRPYGMEALAIARRMGDARRTLDAMVQLEQSTATLGEYENAVELGYEMRRMMAADPSLRTGHANIVLGNLATALTGAGRLDEALAVSREAFPPVQRAGRAYELLDPYAMLAFKRGKVEDAARMIGCSTEQFRLAGIRRFWVEEKMYEELRAALPALLPPERLDALYAEGAAMPPDEAVVLALQD